MKRIAIIVTLLLVLTPVLVSAAPFLIQSPAQYTSGSPNMPTAYAVTSDGWQTFVTESMYVCPIPNPPGYNCQAGDLIVHHDLGQYGPGTVNLELKAIRETANSYYESPSVPFVYGVGTLAAPGGWALVAE